MLFNIQVYFILVSTSSNIRVSKAEKGSVFQSDAWSQRAVLCSAARSIGKKTFTHIFTLMLLFPVHLSHTLKISFNLTFFPWMSMTACWS